MRWLSRRTPQAARRGRHAAGQPRAPQTAAPPPTMAMEVIDPPVIPDPEPAGSGVHLGFADGSEHELTPGDPRVGAFRAVARTLVGV